MTVTDQTWWDFCETERAKELLKQLNEGLIHPIEYAAIIEEYWNEYAK